MTQGGDPRRGREDEVPGAGVLGMWLFLATLTVLFGAAIAGYLVVRLEAPAWPPPGMPRLPAGLWAATAVLLLASGTVQWSLRSVRLGQRTASARGLLATLALGAAFLAIQIGNWWGLVRLRVVGAPNLYAFTFFMLTGLHAAHVTGGLILLAVVTRRMGAGRYGSGKHAGVRYAAMYWHFLAAAWVVLFAILVVFA